MFQIDLTKMPLGKLSRKQIESAYAILSEAQTMVKEGSGSDTKFLDASNRYNKLRFWAKAQLVVIHNVINVTCILS